MASECSEHSDATDLSFAVSPGRVVPNADLREGVRRRILFLTPQLPYPPEQGTALRNYNLLREIARRHDASLLSFAEGSASIPDALSACCQEVRTVPVPKRIRAARLRDLLVALSIGGIIYWVIHLRKERGAGGRRTPCSTPRGEAYPDFPSAVLIPRQATNSSHPGLRRASSQINN